MTLAVEEIHRPLVRDLLGSGSSVEFLGMNGDIEALQVGLKGRSFSAQISYIDMLNLRRRDPQVKYLFSSTRIDSARKGGKSSWRAVICTASCWPFW